VSAVGSLFFHHYVKGLREKQGKNKGDDYRWLCDHGLYGSRIGVCTGCRELALSWFGGDLPNSNPSGK